MKKFYLLLMWCMLHQAQAAQVGDYAAAPPLLAGTQAPMVMLALTHDHSLYTKAYSDYTDLDNDGQIDGTYNNNFEYFGNFDSDFCYAYDTDRFVPIVAAATQTLANGDTAEHICAATGTAANAGSWSGNFLNWMSTTRMDVLRRVLYGGKRYTDPETGTVILERALLPTDTHAFAKVYRGQDMANFTPWPYNSSRTALSFCNVTDGPTGVLSKDVDTGSYPPLLRVASGAWDDWATDEEHQCSYNNTMAPTSSDSLGNFNVRVSACVAGLDASSRHCRAYPNGSRRPAGLLQRYGEPARLRFGLLTGSFEQNNQGGVLRKNIDFIVNNPDPDKNEIDTTTGQFINQEVDTSTGFIKPGIINTLNRLRISQYRFGANNHVYADCDAAGISNSTFVTSNRVDRQCSDWGNPVGEIMLETLRYFSGRTEPEGSYDADDSILHINNLGKVPWEDFMPPSEECSNCAIILLSSGLNTFDRDNIVNSNGNVTNISSANDYKTAAAALAQVEGINGEYMVGRINASTNSSHGVCTPKTVTPDVFDDVRGVCPELPDHDGSYSSAILAYHAKRTDLRPDLDGFQNVDTYTVQLAETVPKFDVEVNGKTVGYVPQCRSEGSGSERQCGMVDVRLLTPMTNQSGSFHIIWEDSSWGNDNDVDAIQLLEYCVGSACLPSVGANQIKFTIDSVRQPESDPVTFGIIVTGTTEDGEYSQVAESSSPGKGKKNNTPLINTPPAEFVLDADGSGALVLENPLWYAAKYGSFDDLDGDGTPLYKGSSTDHREWDTRDVEGNIGADGLPDHYFPVRNPAKLETSLGLIFAYIANQTSSSTSAAVVATSGTGEGALYQAYYYPALEQLDSSGDVENRVSWVGSLQSLMLDRFGRLREDSTSAGTRYKLDDTTIDPIIEIYYDRRIKRTLFARHNGTVETERDLPFDEIEALWSAHKELANVADVVTQRPYTDDAATGRYIFTWIDTNKNGRVDAGAVNTSIGSELIALDATQFNPDVIAFSGNVDWLDLDDESRAADIVNWVRGQDSANMRSRALQLDGDAALETWRVGDIVHSTPVVVGAPEEGYDRLYGDSSYTVFRQQYGDRRQVAYVGANDGLLHAFNAGKRVPGADLVYTGAGHKLGAELWAYAPQNLLPHLQWLVDTDYPHVYYVDGDPQAFDVKAFTPDETHPGGWGTILVVGMRLGGGPVDMKYVQGATPFDSYQTKSAWIIMDITDPEQPPKLLAEFAPSGAGFTTAKPALMKRDGAHGQDWYLLFGSGPTELDSVTSLQDSKLFAWSISQRQEVEVPAALASDAALPNSFVGSIVVNDNDGDYRDDAAWIGFAGGTSSASSGQLKRVDLHSNTSVWFGAATTSDTLINPQQPLLTRPVVSINRFGGARWLGFGTGRLMSAADAPNQQQQTFYGIKDRDATTAITRSDLIDVTHIVVKTNGTIELDNGDPVVIDSETVTLYSRLRTIIDETGGWFFDFLNRNTRGAERTLTDATPFNTFLLFTSFEPGLDSCVIEGQGFLYAVDAFTGLPDPLNAPLGTSDDGSVATAYNTLGPTVPSQPIIHESLEGGSKAIVQGSKGEFIVTLLNQVKAPRGRQSWREIEWEELLQVPGL